MVCYSSGADMGANLFIGLFTVALTYWIVKAAFRAVLKERDLEQWQRERDRHTARRERPGPDTMPDMRADR